MPTANRPRRAPMIPALSPKRSFTDVVAALLAVPHGAVAAKPKPKKRKRS